MSLKAAAMEAKTALENGWREVIDCPYCSGGSVTHYQGRGSTRGRCAYCQGVGRIYRDTLVVPTQSPRSNVIDVDFAGSGLDSSDTPDAA